MKYKYTVSINWQNPSLPAYRHPLIDVELFGPTGSITVNSLLDSGADYCIFNAKYASLIGVDLNACTKAGTRGVGGNTVIPTYRTELEIQVKNLEKIRVPVDFIDSDSVSGLLGQTGFFDLHKIKFERKLNTFEISPV
jgi:hypothetical protein